MEHIQKIYAMSIGGVFVFLGVMGFFFDPLLGLFSVNHYQSLLHLSIGLLGIILGHVGMGRGYTLGLGILCAVLGVLGFIPFTTYWLGYYLSISMETTILHASIGLISLGIFQGVKG